MATQLRLAIDDVPDRVRQAGLVETAANPYSSNGSRRSGYLDNRRRPTALAWQYRKVQLHSETAYSCICLDLDQPNALNRVIAGVNGGFLPAPSWGASNPETTHAHLVFCLAAPVLKRGKAGPRRYRRAVKGKLLRVFEADGGYRENIANNPVHEHWDTAWLHDGGWTLDELNDWLKTIELPDAPAEQPVESKYGGGVDERVFTELMRWAGRKVNLGADFQAEALRICARLKVDESLKSIEAVSQRAAIYQRQWATRESGWHRPEFLAAQRHRQTLQSAARRKRNAPRNERIHELRAAGWSLRAIGAAVGLRESGVRYVLAQAR